MRVVVVLKIPRTGGHGAIFVNRYGDSADLNDLRAQAMASAVDFALRSGAKLDLESASYDVVER